MTHEQWQAFSLFRSRFKEKTAEWARQGALLSRLAAEAARTDTPPYTIETPVVYNCDLDAATPQSDIRLIVIADNPGKHEQEAANCRYLTGQAGKLAQNFFCRNPELGIDFRVNTIILNKTPVHTAKTAHLKYLVKSSAPAADIVRQSQRWMAQETARLHQSLAACAPCGLWIIGYGELKTGGIFDIFRTAFAQSYAGSGAWRQVFVFRHFSMNSFSTELNRFAAQACQSGEEHGIQELLIRIGTAHRTAVFADIAGE